MSALEIDNSSLSIFVYFIEILLRSKKYNIFFNEVPIPVPIFIIGKLFICKSFL